MESFLAVIGFPLVVLLIGLVIEYWVIQPIKQAREYGTVPREERRSWFTATTKALNKFKSQLPHHNGILRRRIFWIEEQEVKRGHSVVRVSISELRYFWENWTKKPLPDERYEMIIDRTGDILASKSLLVEKVQTSEKEKKREKSDTAQKQFHPKPYTAYLYILVGVLGGSSGLSSSLIFNYSSTSNQPSTADSAYLWFYIVATLAGIALAVFVDIYFRMDQAFAWQRLPLALIVGFIGGWVGIFILCIGMLAVSALMIILFIKAFKS